MKTQITGQHSSGVVVAAFDGAADYSTDPLEVSRLALRPSHTSCDVRGEHRFHGYRRRQARNKEPILMDIGDGKEQLMEGPEGHVGKMEAQLRQWGAKLDELVAKAEKAGTEMKIDQRKRIDDLKRSTGRAIEALRAQSGGNESGRLSRLGLRAHEGLEAAFKKMKS